jgi:hypothetical protein
MTAEPTRFLALSLLLLSASCEPSPRCAGQLYFDSVHGTCRPCPMGAHLEGGSCACSDGRAFHNYRCELPEGAMPTADEDAGAQPDAGAADSCSQYCDFIHVCLGGNTLAAGVLPDVITTLHADDPSACGVSCAQARKSASPSSLATCIEAGRDAAQCAGDTTQTGLMNAITLLAQCSRANHDDPLRKLICNGLAQSTVVASQLDFCD